MTEQGVTARAETKGFKEAEAQVDKLGAAEEKLGQQTADAGKASQGAETAQKRLNAAESNYIDGRWIDVDAALRETDCSPTRIAFATSSLKDAGLVELSLPLLTKIGAIDIEILEVEKR